MKNPNVTILGATGAVGREMCIRDRATAVGVELFVLDDGWFGARNSDTAGLGDYTVNRKKLPGGIEGLAQKITTMGLRFGLWFEPESVNLESELYRTHPEWALQQPGRQPSMGCLLYTSHCTDAGQG